MAYPIKYKDYVIMVINCANCRFMATIYDHSGMNYAGETIQYGRESKVIVAAKDIVNGLVEAGLRKEIAMLKAKLEAIQTDRNWRRKRMAVLKRELRSSESKRHTLAIQLQVVEGMIAGLISQRDEAEKLLKAEKCDSCLRY